MTSTELPIWFVRVFAFAWGTIWGSFANVVIHRWPRELSVLRPGSHCPSCGHAVRAYDNVPILAWVWLRGRCRDCKAPISARYPLVEGIYAVLAFAIAEKVFRIPMPASLAAAHWMVDFAFGWGLATASFIDLDTLLIPDVISLPGIVLGILASGLLRGGVGWFDSLFGAGLGFSLPFSLYFIWSRFLKREGMGLGDAKLLAMVGALLGPTSVMFSLGAGALQGLVVTIVSYFTGLPLGPKEALYEDDTSEQDVAPEVVETTTATTEGAPGFMRMRIPFGPFLALGALEYLLGGDEIVRAYLRLLRGGE